ncbi:MAG: hypothetical protein GXP52_01570 [Deltaproteobacteria bacterium]|nr:hypothetical protein [Deltaproteobacteria bacterium]
MEMIHDYDPEIEPESEMWLKADEPERVNAVLQYCEAGEANLPNVLLHAQIHAMVETQTAMGDEIPVAGTLRRLVADGLSRHEAIHAVGWVLSRHGFDVMKGHTAGADPNSRYFEDLRKFTAAQWHAESSPESGK